MPSGELWSVPNSLPLLFLSPPVLPLLQCTSSLGQQSFRINLLQCGLCPGYSSFGEWSLYRIQAGGGVPDRSGAAAVWLDMHMLNSIHPVMLLGLAIFHTHEYTNGVSITLKLFLPCSSSAFL